MRFFFIGIILTLGMLFACLNASEVDFNLYFRTYHVPLSLLLVLAFGMGALVSLLTSGWQLFVLRHENKRLKEQCKHTEIKND